MRRFTGLLGVMLITALFAVSAWSAEEKSDQTALQGTWKGHELTGGDTNGLVYMIITGKKFEFRGADTNEWYKGTFTLKEDAKPKQLMGTISECPAPEYVGKTSVTIYKIQDGTFTLTANEPGRDGAPDSFEADNARRFVFKKE